MSLRGQGVWILGAGFLGSALAAACRVAGADVLTIDVAVPADVRADAADIKALAAGVGRVVPRVAFCCLSTRGGSSEAYRHVYEDSLRALLSAAPAVRPIFCSSVSLYPDLAGGVVDEDTPVRLETERQVCLHRAEQLALLAGGAVARLAPLYGPGRCELLRRHVAREPRLPGEVGRWLNYLHVEDAVQALMRLAQDDARGVFNLCSESFRLGEAYAMMQECTGIPAAETCSAPTKRGSADRRVVSRRYSMPTPQRFCDFVQRELHAPTLL